MKHYYCKLCGITFDSDEENPVCPVCGASGEEIVEVDENGEEIK